MGLCWGWQVSGAGDPWLLLLCGGCPMLLVPDALPVLLVLVLLGEVVWELPVPADPLGAAPDGAPGLPMGSLAAGGALPHHEQLQMCSWGVLHLVLWPLPLNELWRHRRTWVSSPCLRDAAPITLCSASPANPLPSPRDPHGPGCSRIFWPCGSGPSDILGCGDAGGVPSTFCCHRAWWDSRTAPLRGAQHELHLEAPAR